MKYLKRSLVALACAGAVFFTFNVNGFNKRKAAVVVYSYNLTSSTGARNASNWSLIPGGSGASCGTPGEVPCKITFDSSVYPTLQSYIDAQHFTSDDDVAYGAGVSTKQ